MLQPVRSSRALSPVLLAVLALALLLAPVGGQASERKQILLLNSYHQGFTWTDEVCRGLTDVLRPRETGIVLHVEYMDTKRVEFNDHYEEQLKNVYAHKYMGVKLDLILATDNAAYEFLRRHHDELFSGIPVIFGGVNFFRPDQIEHYPLFTGVAEVLDARQTIDCALKLHPGTRTVYVVNDYSCTGRAVCKSIREQLVGLDPAVSVIFSENTDLTHVLERTAGLSGDAVILLGVFNRDVTGRFYDKNEVAEAVSARAQVPVYGILDADLGHGIVGGMLSNGHDQGQAMAQLALHVLAGRSPDEIPVIQGSVYAPKFDYVQLRRFGVNLAGLPADSAIINRPNSFYREHSAVLLAVLGFGALQFLIILALVLNITRRRRAEKELRTAHRTLEERVKERTSKLRESEEVLRTVFDFAYDAIIIHDGQGRILEVNQRMIEMFGLEGMDPSGVSLAQDLSSPDNPLHAMAGIMREVLDGRPHHLEWRVRRYRDSREFDVEVHLTRITYRGEEAILANVRDISVRKESENSIRQNLVKFEAILENSLMGIAMTVGRRIVTINRRGAEIFGYSPEEMQDNTLNLLLGHYQTQDEFVLAAKAALAERGEFNTEQAFRSKNGSTVWCRMYAKTVDPGDLTRGVIWAWDDVTENRKAQEDLLRTREDAEAANRAKSEFLAAMSHEIRTPMNAIVGMTEITLQTDLTDDQRDYLKTVKDSAQHLLSIINDILDLSKIEARKLELDHVDFDLPFHVRTTIKGLEVQARQKGLDMVLEIDEAAPNCVKGDPLSLRQVLVNLAGNAIKFTHRGTIAIRVGPGQGPAPDEARTVGVAFAVEDTGIGIPREFLDSIFQSFSQTTRAFGGTGLGLAICKQLISLMGGDIVVESTVGKGSTFSFTVWFEPGFSCPMPVETEERRPEGPTRPVRVLVAEDNDVNIMVTTLKLEDMGYTYAVAKTGLEVLDLLKREPFDLILMDIEMPVLDGISTTKAIRSAVPGGPIPDPDIPIIGVTAHALKEFRDKSLDAGMDDYVAKPVDFHELAVIINRLIGAAPASAPPNAKADGPAPASLDALPPWTPDAAMEHLGVDEAIFADFLVTARTELALLLDELGQALGAGHAAKAEELAVTARSVCTAIGANGAALAAGSLASACRGEGGADGLLDRFREEVREVMKIMD
ncbi:multi-sensor hybrid histidine kinase [Pseudodesulfovibrio mercurii]|uniref:Sensory/regulatory protein RpfC n=1 Tax=Pseudodesulfovibrio mercurii TaxID=641491 RepID=F0JI79_9BACT|nr:PAS domain S-box protein [Pseudodesulfovibrio mercurii]EGB15390.1 multi-sensor hybrid histidine kinase [Pseudodesulfovibrio mercurii]